MTRILRHLEVKRHVGAKEVIGKVILYCLGTVFHRSQESYLSKEALTDYEEQSCCCASSSFDGN